MTDAATLARMIRAGSGEAPADLVIRDVRLLDVVDRQPHPNGCGHRGRQDRRHACTPIVARTEVDGHGRFCVPGFIDTHLHIESSLITPFEFDRLVLPHGVTTAICDPHEIANVLGAERNPLLSRLRRADRHGPAGQPIVMRAGDRSTRQLERTLEVADLLPFADHPKVIGLAEFMNFPGCAGGRTPGTRQACGVPGPPYRRPCPAATRNEAQRLSGGRHSH